MGGRLIFRPIFILSLFFILSAVTNFMRVMKIEYIRSFTENENSTAAKFVFDNDLSIHRLKTSSGAIAMDLNTVIQGSIVFINGRQQINCYPNFFLKRNTEGLIHLGLDCQEERLSVFTAIVLETVLGASKSIVLLLFVYVSVLWCHRDLSARNFKGLGPRKDVIYYKTTYNKDGNREEESMKLRKCLTEMVLNVKNLEDARAKTMGFA